MNICRCSRFWTIELRPSSDWGSEDIPGLGWKLLLNPYLDSLKNVDFLNFLLTEASILHLSFVFLFFGGYRGGTGD